MISARAGRRRRARAPGVEGAPVPLQELPDTRAGLLGRATHADREPFQQAQPKVVLARSRSAGFGRGRARRHRPQPSARAQPARADNPDHPGVRVRLRAGARLMCMSDSMVISAGTFELHGFQHSP